jgi:hypothetical protein
MTTPKAGVAHTVSAVHGDPGSADLEAGINAEDNPSNPTAQAVRWIARTRGMSRARAAVVVEHAGLGGRAA